MTRRELSSAARFQQVVARGKRYVERLLEAARRGNVVIPDNHDCLREKRRYESISPGKMFDTSDNFHQTRGERRVESVQFRIEFYNTTPAHLHQPVTVITTSRSTETIPLDQNHQPKRGRFEEQQSSRRIDPTGFHRRDPTEGFSNRPQIKLNRNQRRRLRNKMERKREYSRIRGRHERERDQYRLHERERTEQDRLRKLEQDRQLCGWNKPQPILDLPLSRSEENLESVDEYRKPVLIPLEERTDLPDPRTIGNLFYQQMGVEQRKKTRWGPIEAVVTSTTTSY